MSPCFLFKLDVSSFQRSYQIQCQALIVFELLSKLAEVTLFGLWNWSSYKSTGHIGIRIQQCFSLSPTYLLSHFTYICEFCWRRQGAISSILLGKLLVPIYGILLYYWSVIVHRWDISPRTLKWNGTQPRSE